MECRVVGAAVRLVLVVALMAQGLGTRAQDGHAAPSTDAVASVERRIVTADSARDAIAGASLRLELSGLVKSYQGLKLLHEAAGLLDSAGTAPELALRVHKDLASRYTALSSHEKATREWAEVARLSDVLRDEAAAAVEQAHFVNAVSKSRIDSLTTAMAMAKANHVNAMERLTVDQARREELALYAIGGGMLMLVISTAFFTLHIRKQRAALKELRQEVTWLRLVAKKGTEPTVVASSVAPPSVPKVELPVVVGPVAPPIVTPPAPLRDPEEDAMLLALVRRRGVERLQTLREARAVGDNDKVVRVVHTMKPQLVSIDATYFQDLCGRLVSTDPRTDPLRWSEDLDRFEAGMARVLEQRV